MSHAAVPRRRLRSALVAAALTFMPITVAPGMAPSGVAPGITAGRTPFGAASAAAQAAGDTVTRAANPDYAIAGGLSRLMLGSNWRDLWVMPVRVPVLDLARFAGGIRPERRGGGRQSITLHMIDASGGAWIFRSIDKHPEQGVSPELVGTPIGGIIKDQVSMLNPGGHFVMPALLDAVDVLHATPRFFVMPDDPVLGEHRETFAGMFGEIEERPTEGEDDTPGFAGSRKVKNTGNFLDDIEDSGEHRLDEREFLRARLIDFVVGDPDRGTDQWRWARFGEEGAYRWRPIPRDRDWVLVRPNGLLVRGAAKVYPKITPFETDYPSIETLTYSSHILDRRLLTRLTRQDFAAEAARVVAAVTDDVIARAVAALPPEYAAARGAMIAATLRARRDQVPQIAAEFYDWLATEVDVRATDNADLAVLERRPDGTVLVTIRSETEPFYERLFDPAETREVRVFMHGGPDSVRVTGAADGPIRLRVIGGGGDDTLIDEAGNARFYDDRGDNHVVRTAGTRFSAKVWRAPLAPEGLRVGADWSPDWGGSRGIGPVADYEEVSGVTIGARGTIIRYGFRRLPHRWRVDGRALVAPATGGLGAELDVDFRPENARHRMVLHAATTQIEAFRFHGFGNDAPARGSELTLHRKDVIRVEPAVEWALGPLPGRPVEDDAEDDAGDDNDGEQADVVMSGTIRAGPVFGWARARPPAAQAGGSVADASSTQLGARAGIELRRTDHERLPRRGFRVKAEAAGYPAVRGDSDVGAFGRVSGQMAGYVPLASGDRPYLAVRVGGERVFGDFPAWEAAFIGGRHSLRGYSRGRLAGESGVHGGVELRMPVDTVRLLVRTELGVFGFGDVGRVWYESESPGGWHSGWGGGVWLGAFGRALSIAVARGEGSRVHAWLGLPF